MHAVLFDVRGAEYMDVMFCVGHFGMCHLVLQKEAPFPAQTTDLFMSEQSAVLSVVTWDIPSQGYVTLAVVGRGDDCDGNNWTVNDLDTALLHSWAVVQDISTGTRPMEVPVQTAGVDKVTGKVSCVAMNCSGLISTDSNVLARFDVNPHQNSETKVFVWLNSNGKAISRTEYSRKL